MKRKCIHRLAVTAFLAVALLATVVQPSYAAPKPQHRVSVAPSSDPVQAAIAWFGHYLLQKIYTSGGTSTPPPPARPGGIPTGGGSGPFGGSCLDPSGFPVGCTGF
jgi:hypothetical protein